MNFIFCDPILYKLKCQIYHSSMFVIYFACRVILNVIISNIVLKLKLLFISLPSYFCETIQNQFRFWVIDHVKSESGIDSQMIILNWFSSFIWISSEMIMISFKKSSHLIQKHCNNGLEFIQYKFKNHFCSCLLHIFIAFISTSNKSIS